MRNRTAKRNNYLITIKKTNYFTQFFHNGSEQEELPMRIYSGRLFTRSVSYFVWCELCYSATVSQVHTTNFLLTPPLYKIYWCLLIKLQDRFISKIGRFRGG